MTNKKEWPDFSKDSSSSYGGWPNKRKGRPEDFPKEEEQSLETEEEERQDDKG